MRRIAFFIVLILAAITPSAHAQFTLYGTLSFPHITNAPDGSIYTHGGYQSQTINYTPTSFTGGATFNFLPLHIIALGLDLRGTTRGDTPGADSILAGIKLGVHPPHIALKPYIEAAAGDLTTRTTNISTTSTHSTPIGGTDSTNHAIFEVIGGVDYPLIHFVDLRIVEVGVGHTLFGGSDSVGVVNVSTGLTLHF